MMQVSLRQTVGRGALAGLVFALVALAAAPAAAQPPKAAAIVRESQTLVQKGQAAKALQRLEEAVKADPNAAEALAMKAWLHATSADPKIRNPRQAVADAASAVQIANYTQRRARAGTENIPQWSKAQRLANLYSAALAYAASGNYTQGVGHALYAVEAARRLNETSPSQESKELLAASEAALKRITETDKTAAQNAMQRIDQACLVTGQNDVMGNPVEFAGVAPPPLVTSRPQ